MHAALMETMSSNALLVRQRSHLSASSSGRECALRNAFSRGHRRSARPCCQQQDRQNGSERVRQKFEKYPDGPSRVDTPVEAYRRDVIAGRGFERLSVDSHAELRGYVSNHPHEVLAVDHMSARSELTSL